MDKFGVPKKVNRHVLKAIYVINKTKCKSPQYKDILKVVRTTMKNNAPVKNLTRAVLLSLRNMSQIGLIRRRGTSFSVPKSNPAIINSKLCGRKIQDIKNQQTEKKSLLDLNLKKTSSSTGSITKCDIRMSRKRILPRPPMPLKVRRIDYQKAKKPLVMLRRMNNAIDTGSRKIHRSIDRKLDLNAIKRRHSTPSIDSSDCDIKKPKLMLLGPSRSRTLRASKLKNGTRSNITGMKCRRSKTLKSRAMWNKENVRPRTVGNDAVSNLTIDRIQTSAAAEKVEPKNFQLNCGGTEADRINREDVISSNRERSDIINLLSSGVVESKNFVKNLFSMLNPMYHQSVETGTQNPVACIKITDIKSEVTDNEYE